MFCACANSFGDEPNTNVCPVCMGMPGALPTLNKFAIEQTILSGMLLGCSTPPISKWDRKSYFYPDMPKNFQTSQFDLPLCLGGEVPLYENCFPTDAKNAAKISKSSIALTRIHLEEDVGKSTHVAGATLLDFNRAGTPLMEIVSEPDITTAEEAYAYIKSLQQILIVGGISDADMEKGQLRCDVNISLRPHTQSHYGAKIELKNLNSISAVRRAIQFEILRQAEELDLGIEQIQSTRRWDDDAGESYLMRTKEDAHDYRYFTCPDLVPLHTAAIIEQVKQRIPELPHQKLQRYQQQLELNPAEAALLSADVSLSAMFESMLGFEKESPKKLASWLVNTLVGYCKENELELGTLALDAKQLSQVFGAIQQGSISSSQSREVLAAWLQKPESNIEDLLKALGFGKADDSQLEGWVETVVTANSDKVNEVLGGNEKLLNWLTGQVMKLAAGKTNPKLATEALRKRIGL